MSVGPFGGVFASVAGSPLAQTAGSDVDRSRQAASNQQRQVQAHEKAEAAAGIGKADGEEHQTNDRDADGRRLWEFGRPVKAADGNAAEAPAPSLSKDASGASGNQLDLSG
jgi:hypothetical protein